METKHKNTNEQQNNSHNSRTGKRLAVHVIPPLAIVWVQSWRLLIEVLASGIVRNRLRDVSDVR